MKTTQIRAYQDDGRWLDKLARKMRPMQGRTHRPDVIRMLRRVYETKAEEAK